MTAEVVHGWFGRFLLLLVLIRDAVSFVVLLFEQLIIAFGMCVWFCIFLLLQLGLLENDFFLLPFWLRLYLKVKDGRRSFKRMNLYFLLLPSFVLLLKFQLTQFLIKSDCILTG